MDALSLKHYFSGDSLRPEVAIQRFYHGNSELSTMIDLGANNGFHSIGFVRGYAARNLRKCIAVEANQGTYSELLSKINNAGLSQSIEPVFAAAQDNPEIEEVRFMECDELPGRSGIIPFWTGMPDNEVSGMTFTNKAVPATTIDKLVDQFKLDSLSFIKADLEGGEYSAFRGGMKTLSILKPVVVFEKHCVRKSIWL